MKAPFLPLLALSVAAAAHAAIFERIVAKVNGEIITLSDLENRQLAAIQAANIPNERVPLFLREHGERILQEAIDEMLVYQKGEELGIADRIPNDYLDKVIDGIKKEHNIESDEVFRTQLVREGLTVEGLRRNIKRSIVRDQVIKTQVDTKIAVADEELRKEYQKRKADYTHPESVRLQEIVLKPDTSEVRAKAADLAKRARGGEDFASLAKEHSVAGTRTAGGDLGTVALAELHNELRKAISGAAAGHVTDPIALAGTVRVLKLNERQEARTIPFEEAREELTRRVKHERRQAELGRFVQELRADSEIKKMVREAPVTTDVTIPAEGGILRDSTVAPPPELSNAGKPSVLAPPPPGVDDDEVVVSPQDRPTKVAPDVPLPTPTPPGQGPPK